MIKRSMLAAAIALAFAGPAAAQYDATVFFGDSLSDSGTYASIGAVPSAVGKFTTNPGPVWTEDLAAKLGTTAAPAAAGGTDYAMGGARVTAAPGPDATPPSNLALPVATQITNYLAQNGGHANGNTLYSVWAGANDIFAAALAPATAQAQLTQAVGDLVTQIARLRAAGAQYIVVLNMPDIGTTPGGVAQGAAGSAGLTQLSQGYNQLLGIGLESAGLRVIPVNTFALFREITANPATYGFTDPLALTVPACTTSSALICSAASLRPGATPLNTVFADAIHPTTGGHQIIADLVASELAAPRQMALIAESMVKTRLALGETIQNQLVTAGGANAGATRAWATVNGGRLEFRGSADMSQAKGNPYGVTVGLDHRVSPDLLVGVTGSLGRTDPDFADGGGFRLDEAALSLYAAWRSGPLSLTTIGTIGQSNIDVNRDVHLGPATRRESGSTKGDNVSLAMRGAYELGSGPLSHGPFIGADFQRIDVRAFSESSNDSSALGYSRQNRTSIVGSLGYQGSYDMGMVTPFGRVAIDHEFRDEDRSVTAYLRSMQAPSFETPALKLDRTWATATVGAALKLGANLTGTVALSSQFGQSDVRHYAVQVGLAIGL